MRKDKLLGALPNPLALADGRTVTTADEWRERRAEIYDDVIDLEYDGLPPRPDGMRLEKLALDGAGNANCYRVHCYIGGKDFTFCYTLYRTKEEGKRPVIVTGDAQWFRNCTAQVIDEALSRGFSVVKFNRVEFAPDLYNTDRIDGIYPLFPGSKFSAISAWAWGYHRVIDTLYEIDCIDTERIVVSGHSRGGKTVLLAAATDERVWLCNPNDSGAHGCGCYRFEQHEDSPENGDARNETLADMFKSISYWMGQRLRQYIGKEETLPHDMHFVKALIAPRALLETNAYGDTWANPRGSYISFLGAREVWKTLGCEERCVTHYREGGHAHQYPDFLVLFDFMERLIAGTADKACPAPYDDMDEHIKLALPWINE